VNQLLAVRSQFRILNPLAELGRHECGELGIGGRISEDPAEVPQPDRESGLLVQVLPEPDTLLARGQACDSNAIPCVASRSSLSGA
jgi:hypothetical protein